MKPALRKFVNDWLGDSPPAEVLEALHAAIRADREAALGHMIRLLENDGEMITNDWDDCGYDYDFIHRIIAECWELPTGLEPDEG